MITTDFLITGAGIVGLSLAGSLAKRYPGARILILEKESNLAFHASGRNSGVLHAGFYYDADSLKAKLTVAGNRAMTAYCLEHGLSINRCGKVVVAADENEIEGIRELKRRGDVNGVELELIDERRLHELEPNAKTCEIALFSPTTSSVAPKPVCRHIAANLPKRVTIRFNSPFLGLKKGMAVTHGETIRFSYLFNAAGLYADQIAHQFGVGKQYTMMPFKGIYLACMDDHLIKRHIYPVPNLHNPFLGVHFTVTVNHHVKIGPTAMPAFWRENYDFTHRFRREEFFEILGLQSRLFWKNSFNFRMLAYHELKKYIRGHFIGESRKLVKRLDPGRFGGFLTPGIRAQLLDLNTLKLVMDFVIEYGESSTHILNSISPAFTTALPFAEFVLDACQAKLDRL